ncbi:peptidase M50 [Mycobacterium spongiae]|uniref:Peptidase M50 n=1 Tax=Mycobacterium spongiae TaxID=886343 RepID=A0A975JUV5_9MYCO|nr:peptidase M50 [Mycobacterium spongiae]QUR66129.1 peptidase M50 [Mycobacterium spongiae]
MNRAEMTPAIAVLLFGDGRPPRPLSGLPAHHVEDPTAIDTALGPYSRLVVVGADADLAAVLTRLLRSNRLDVEVGYAPRRRTAATRAYGLPAGRRAARRARHGTPDRVPLIRDETGAVVVGHARWLPADGQALIHGEAVVDDTALFDGDVAGMSIEPTLALPGLRAAVQHRPRRRRRPRRWISGRAAQLGTTGATVVRDGVAAPRSVRRSTFYRNVEGWLLVR